MKAINAIRMGGMEVLPLVEGGKGVSVSNGISSGNWAATGGVGTVQRRQRRQLRRAGPAHRAGLSRPHPDASGTRSWSPTRSGWRDHPGPSGVRALGRQGAHPRQHPVGDGRRRADHHRGARTGEGPDPRPHLRRRHALPSLGHRGAVQRLLLPDRLLRAGVQRALEARLLQGGVPCSAAWSTRTRGSPAAITGSRTARTRPGRRTRSRACSALRRTMRQFGLDQTPIIMAGGVWWLRRMAGLDRQPGARSDRLPVRHAAAADPGEPDRRRLEGSGC